jgi:hypothetical protein
MVYVTVRTHIGLLTITGASTARRVARGNGEEGSQETNDPSMALEL